MPNSVDPDQMPYFAASIWVCIVCSGCLPRYFELYGILLFSNADLFVRRFLYNFIRIPFESTMLAHRVDISLCYVIIAVIIAKV